LKVCASSIELKTFLLEQLNYNLLANKYKTYTNVLFSKGVEDLDLEAAFHMVFEISHVHKDARISFGIELELEIEDEIAVLTIGSQVILVPRPAGFIWARFECNDVALFHDPVAGCIPAV
jgi:cell division GTPase FtsZ